MVLLLREFWQNEDVSDLQRDALLDHELCHAEVKLDRVTGEPLEDERGRICWRLRGHDVEEFAAIISRRGIWKRDLEHFFAAHRLRENGEQKPLPIPIDWFAVTLFAGWVVCMGFTFGWYRKWGGWSSTEFTAVATAAVVLPVVMVARMWGGASPETGFDCSGFTMWSWAHAGVSLPHSSAAQYAALPHVAREDLQPGDLLFFYSPISHVAMYIGNQQMIEAYDAATPVRVTAVRFGTDYWGAERFLTDGR